MYLELVLRLATGTSVVFDRGSMNANHYINTCILSGCLASSTTPLSFSMEDIYICNRA